MLKVKDMKNVMALMIPCEFPIYAYSYIFHKIQPLWDNSEKNPIFQNFQQCSVSKY